MTTKTGLKRDTIDKFYTKPIIANKFIKITKKVIDEGKNNIDLIIEPSARYKSIII